MHPLKLISRGRCALRVLEKESSPHGHSCADDAAPHTVPLELCLLTSTAALKPSGLMLCFDKHTAASSCVKPWCVEDFAPSQDNLFTFL